MIHKRRTALEWSVKNVLLEGLTGFMAPTSPLVKMWIKTHRCLICMKDPNLNMHHLIEHINQDKQRYRLNST